MNFKESQKNILNTGDTRSTIVICCILSILVAAVFWQVVSFEFVNFDDPIYITENKHVQQGLTLDTVEWAFTTHLHGHYHPLTWLNHAFDYMLFGLDATGHHFNGFLLHLVSTLLLFFVLRKMTGQTWPSGFAAALFGLHPLHVEPVAWVADRKDLLFGFFWILSLFIYTKAVEKQSYWYAFLLILTYILGLLSKTMMITLPLVLLILDFWPLKRIGVQANDAGKGFPGSSITRILLEKAGLLIIAGIFVLITTTAMQDLRIESKTLSPYWQYDFLLFVQHYLEKFVWPVNLTVLYPYNENPEIISYVLAAILLLTITILAFHFRKKLPFLLAGWLWFLVTMLPVAGIIHEGPHRVADRYTYIPLIGLIIALTWSGYSISCKGKKQKKIIAALGCALLAVISYLSFTQAAKWQSSLKLFEHAVQIYPNNWVAHNNLGDALDQGGKKDEALEHYYTALQLKPDYAKAHYNLGNTLVSMGKQDQALDHFLTALTIYPEFAEAHNNAGVLLAQKKRYLEAKKYFTTAIKLDPEYDDAKTNLDDLVGLIQGLENQIAEFQEQLRTSPNNAELHNNLGLLYREGGDIQLSENHFKEAISINQNFAGAHNNLGILFAEQGKLIEARIHFQQAVTLDPLFEGAQMNLQRINELLSEK